MQNLDKCTGFLLHYPLTNSDKDKIRGKLAVLSPRIRNHPKTLKRKLRAKLGSTVPCRMIYTHEGTHPYINLEDSRIINYIVACTI